jgi:ribonuclease D
MFHCEPSQYSIVSNVADINSIAEEMRSEVNARPGNKRAIALDIEHEYGSTFIGGRDTLAIIQLYAGSHAFILQVRRLTRLPDRLVALLNDPCVRFTGKQVRQDFQKIAKYFKCVLELRMSRFSDMAHMAAARGLCRHKTASFKTFLALR